MGREIITNTVTLTISPEGKTISNIPWTSGMNVQNAMELAYGISPGIEFAIQYYGSSLGYLVLMVDGTYDVSPQYWFLYVNNVLSNYGIDNTFLNSGDVVGLTYQSFQPDQHGETLYKAKSEFFAHGQKPKRL